MTTLNRHKGRTRGRVRSLISLMMVMSLILVYPGGALADSPSIAQYTAYPPFGGTLVKPNVLINLDTSTSLSYFAYDFDWNARAASGGGGGGGGGMGGGGTLTPPVSKGFSPSTTTYYGYFDSDKKYSYSSGEFIENITGSWDGNFLNWLTMRRSDIIKKALIGGKTRIRVGMAGDVDDLIGDPPYANSKYLGYQKQICVTEDGTLDPSLYTPYSSSNCPLTFTFDNDEGERMGGNGRRWWDTADIPAFSKGDTYSSSPSTNDFKVVVHRTTEPEGIIQRVGDNVRWGLEVMNNGYWTTGTRMGGGGGGGGGCHGDGEDETGGSGKGGGKKSTVRDVAGGTVLVPVGYNKVGEIVTEIAAAAPYTPTTPIAESVWTATGYFQQYATKSATEGPRYFTGATDRGRWGRAGSWAASYPIGDDVDPYNYADNPSTDTKWVPCAKSYVITLTDGEPTQDISLPTTQKGYGGSSPDYADSGASRLPGWQDTANNYFWDSELQGSHYVDNVALWSHTDINNNYRDLRTGTLGTKAIPGDDATKWQQNLTHYFIYANFGTGTPDGRRLLNWSKGWTGTGGGAARNGGFIESGANYQPDATGEYNSDGDGNDDTFFEATDGYQLEAALIKALYDIIFDSKKSGTASAIVGTRGGVGTIYQAYFYPGIDSTDPATNPDNIAVTGERRWLGFLKALSVDADGNFVDDDNDGNPDILWEAGKKLWERTTARTIYTTTDGSTRITFDPDAAATVTDLQPLLRAEDNDEAEAIMRYIIGEYDNPTVNSTTYNYRPRKVSIDLDEDGDTLDAGEGSKVWKLGDIVYSSPTPVGAPTERYDKYYADTTYAAFYTQYKDRSTVVYAGANDGMLHAFDGATGEELWAFIPKQLLPHLKWLTDPNYTHVYYVDLKPKVTDAQIFTADADHPNGWGTILIGGMRFGGKNISGTSESPAYFALDITDPSNPRLLWTFTNSSLGLTTSYPAIARVKGSADLWVMIVGSGPTDFDALSNVSSAQTGKVFVVDLGSGGLLKTFDLGTNTFMADPIAIDVSLDYKVDVAYIGDADGNMYRLVTKNSANVADWTLSTLIATSGTGQQITSAPSAALDGNRNLWVYFGTGKFIGSEDKQTTDAQAFYGVKDICKPWIDPGTGYPSCTGSTVSDNSTDLYNASSVEVCEGGDVTNCDTAAQTWSSITSDAGAKKGWKINFSSVSGHTSLTGERSLAKPLVVGGLVMFTTYIPEDELCSENEGAGYLWAVYYKTGTAYKKHVFTETTTVTREKSVGEGFATVTATVTKGGGLKTFASTLLGANIQVPMNTALTLTSGLSGWSLQCGE